MAEQQCADTKMVSSIKPYPPLDTAKLPRAPAYGPLGQLAGTWVNAPGVFGLHTTIMPAPGSSSEQIFGTYHFKAQEYTEELVFTKFGHPVRNRGGSNEQFNGAVKYDTTITDRNGDIQHVENGMYLWLGAWGDDNPEHEQYQGEPANLFSRKATEQDVEQNFTYPVLAAGAQGPQFIPPYSISRAGVIPHGATVHLLGNSTSWKNVRGEHKEPEPTPVIAGLWDQASLAIDPTMGYSARQLQADTGGKQEKPFWAGFPISQSLLGLEKLYPNKKDATELDATSGQAYVQRIFNYEQELTGAPKDPLFPYTVQPNLKLTEANQGLKFLGYELIELSSAQATGPQGGVLQNVMVGRYAPTTSMKLRLWIEKVELADGRVVDQLQYEQVVFFQFQFASGGQTTQWPHIQVNTLRRKEDL